MSARQTVVSLPTAVTLLTVDTLRNATLWANLFQTLLLAVLLNAPAAAGTATTHHATASSANEAANNADTAAQTDPSRNRMDDAVERLQRLQLQRQYRDGADVEVLPPPTDLLAVQARWRKAIMNDDVITLSGLLEAATNPRQLAVVKSENHKTALMIASKLGAQTLFDQLLELGADISAVTTTGGTPVMFASLGGHRSLVRRLAGLGASIDAQGANGWSSLTIAAAKGYTALAGDLLALGADINAIDVYGWTPMMRAVDNRHRDTVKRLLEEPAVLLDHQDEGGNTALHYAAANLDQMLIRLLLLQGADAGVRNHKGQLARDVAATRPRSGAVLEQLDRTDDVNSND